MPHIDYITLTDYDERYAPPEENVLRVCLIGNQLFLTVAKHIESAEGVYYETKETIGVRLGSLLYAIEALAQDQLITKREEPLPEESAAMWAESSQDSVREAQESVLDSAVAEARVEDLERDLAREKAARKEAEKALLREQATSAHWKDSAEYWREFSARL